MYLHNLCSYDKKSSQEYLVALKKKIHVVPCKSPGCHVLKITGNPKPWPTDLLCIVLKPRKQQNLIVKNRRGSKLNAIMIQDENYRIGKGTFSQIHCVWLKFHGKPMEKLALKNTNKEDGDLSEIEAKIMLRLNHPNIILLKYYCEGTESIQLFMEVMEEGDLFHLIHHSWNRSDGLGIYCELFAFQIFRGLAYMHSRDIMHRDIKPENVLISRATGVAKLIDFNCSTFMDPTKTHSPHVGTKIFNAPELLLGTESYDEKVDVWSAAATFTSMITKRPVFFVHIHDVRNPIRYIFDYLGPPSPRELGVMKIPIQKRSKCPEVVRSKELIDALKGSPGIHNETLLVDLLSNIFTYDTEKRYSAREACEHELFDFIKTHPMSLSNGKPLPDVFSLSE